MGALPPTNEQIQVQHIKINSKINTSTSSSPLSKEIEKNSLFLCSTPVLNTPSNNIEQNLNSDLKKINHIPLRVTPIPSLSTNVFATISVDKKEVIYKSELSSLKIVPITEPTVTTTPLVESTLSVITAKSLNNLLSENNIKTKNETLLNNKNLEKQEYTSEILEQKQVLNTKKINSNENKQTLDSELNSDENKQNLNLELLNLNKNKQILHSKLLNSDKNKNFVKSYNIKSRNFENSDINNNNIRNEVDRTYAAKTQQSNNIVTETKTFFSQKNTSFKVI